MHFYTFCLILLISCSQVFSLDVPEAAYDKPSMECMEKWQVTKADTEKFFDENFHLDATHPKALEVIECIMKAKKTIDVNGNFDQALVSEGIAKVLLPVLNKTENQIEVANKATKKCIENNTGHSGHDLGERIKKLNDCIVDTVKSL